MAYYGIEPYFWTKLLLLVLTLIILLLVFEVIMKKALKLKRRKLFADSRVNPLHKKIDWTVRTLFVAAMIAGVFVNASRPPSERVLLLEPFVLLLILLYVTEIITAVMQRKYTEDKREAALTVYRLLFTSLLLILVYFTDFFGLF